MRESIEEKNRRLRLEIGGNFDSVGKLEMYLLQSLGLTGGQTVVDVGCGCGRLAAQLAAIDDLRYFGFDLNSEYLDYAKRMTVKDDFKFAKTTGTDLLLPADMADFVCFFSVLTHLHHEDSFRYLRNAARVLKPGGLVVFSFLEFRIASHWEIFRKTVETNPYGHMENQFIDRDAIRCWADHLDLKVVDLLDGDKPQFPIPEVVVWDGGQRMENQGWLGQSVAVLKSARA